jgi:hypothetical protein
MFEKAYRAFLIHFCMFWQTSKVFGRHNFHVSNFSETCQKTLHVALSTVSRQTQAAFPPFPEVEPAFPPFPQGGARQVEPAFLSFPYVEPGSPEVHFHTLQF